MGGVILLPELGIGSLPWLCDAVRDSQRYLVPFRGGWPTSPHICFHIQRALRRCHAAGRALHVHRRAHRWEPVLIAGIALQRGARDFHFRIRDDKA